MELYNECLVYLITLHMMFYTQFVERENHELMGYSMIGLVLLYLGSNIILVFQAAVWGMILTAQKYWNVYKKRQSDATVNPEPLMHWPAPRAPEIKTGMKIEIVVPEIDLEE
jgi:hypothetical protein